MNISKYSLFLLIAAFLILFTACKKQPDNSIEVANRKTIQAKDNQKAQVQQITGDTLTGFDKTKRINEKANKNIDSQSKIFDKNCVIFLIPDSTEIAEMEAQYDPGEFNEFIADFNWYTGMARIMLDSFAIENEICDKEIIILKDSRHFETKLERKKLTGDMILFHIDKHPVITFSAEYDRNAVLEYFDIQTTISSH